MAIFSKSSFPLTNAILWKLTSQKNSGRRADELSNSVSSEAPWGPVYLESGTTGIKFEGRGWAAAGMGGGGC